MKYFKFAIAGAVAALFAMSACNNPKKTAEPVDDEAFYATQPMHSGHYDAMSYDIQGKNARAGKFDGRIFIALSPSQSMIYVYENGNRAKIDYKVVLDRPFEKGDSGIYRTADTKGMPVVIAPDSAGYVLKFEKPESKVAVSFSGTPRSTWSALETLEHMSSQINSKK